MRIKKKDLRRRLPQLPINYPGPIIEEPFNYNRESGRVENLCTRLADNEVETRDAVLREIPRFILEVCSRSQFLPLARQQDANLPASFSYEVLSEFLLAPNDQAAAAIAAKQCPDASLRAMLFTPAVRDMGLLFDKLNTGIFFNLWHSDKPLVQHECSQRIAMLVHVPPSYLLKLMFWRSMWRALSTKWSVIDHHRMDKYMAYVRKLMLQSLRVISKIAVAEATPIQWTITTTPESSSSSAVSKNKKTKKDSSNTSSVNQSERNIVVATSADEVVADAMRLIGNEHKLAVWKEISSQFQLKKTAHLQRKRQRREAHEAATAAKLQKKIKSKQQQYAAATAAEASVAAAPAGKRKTKLAAAAAAAAKKQQEEEGERQAQAEEEAEELAEKKKAASIAAKQAKKNGTALSSSPHAPPAATFLTAFGDMIRVDVFCSNTSVGLSMHLVDVILDEMRRCCVAAGGSSEDLQNRPSVLLALLTSIPLRAMAAAEVMQVERRVTLMVVQPIAGGIFERFFEKQKKEAKDSDDDDSDDALATERKLLAALNDKSSGSDDDDHFDADAAGKKRRGAGDDGDEEEDSRFSVGVQKAVILADAVTTVLKNLALDPRTRFAMRPLLEEASRSIAAYVLHRRRPEEYTLVTAQDKRKMLNEAVARKMFGSSRETDDTLGVDMRDKAAVEMRKKRAAVVDGQMARQLKKSEERRAKREGEKQARKAAGLPDPKMVKRAGKTQVFKRRKKIAKKRQALGR